MQKTDYFARCPKTILILTNKSLMYLTRLL